MKTEVYNLEGVRVGEVELPETIFSRSWNDDLVYQAVIALQANRRPTVAHVKDRGEVRGGGIKPRPQKGTGRSRHGSIRSPIWIGGGVTHGPRAERNYRKKLNKKMAKAALYSALSRRLAEGEIKVIDSFDMKELKTKELARVLSHFSPNVLLVPSEAHKGLARIARNLPKVTTARPDALNAENVLQRGQVLIEKAALAELH